ncbi:hypothetical protein JHD50_00165 [Sulfurimonas sp. MAG313]|nr:YfaZ family outer membrane protein [Sulfurimonas sp. MAG313]MDF1879727.1 hypothetical protein [Sulfurimonas sp. MAG313]
MLKKLMLSLCFSTSLFAMHDVSVSLNNEDLEIQGSLDIGELNKSDFPDTYFLTLGLLNVDGTLSTNPLSYIGFMLRQEISGTKNLRFGVGFKATYTKVSGVTHMTAPLNAELAYTLPLDMTLPLTLFANVAYAPNVLSFSDASKYFESRLEIQLQIIEQGNIFLGYRHIEVGFENQSTYKYSGAGYLGFKIRF